MSPPNNEWSPRTLDPTTGRYKRTRREGNGETITQYEAPQYSQPANHPAPTRPVYGNPQQQGYYPGSANPYPQYPAPTAHPNYYQPPPYQYSSEQTTFGQTGHSSARDTSRSSFPATSALFNSSSWQQEDPNYTHPSPVAGFQAAHQRYQGQLATYDDDIYSAEDQASSGATYDRTARTHPQLSQRNSPSETRPSQEVDSANEVPLEYPSEREIRHEPSFNDSALRPTSSAPNNYVARVPYAETAPQSRFDSSRPAAFETGSASENQDEEEVGSQISSHSGVETPRPLPYFRPPPERRTSVDISRRQASAAFGPNPTGQIIQGTADLAVGRKSDVSDEAEPEMPRHFSSSIRSGRETRYISGQSKQAQDRAKSRVRSSDNSLARRQPDSSRETSYHHTEREPPRDEFQEQRRAYSYGSFRNEEKEAPKRDQSTMPPPTSAPIPTSKGYNQPMKLDKAFQVCHSSEFSKGRVFKVLWSEPAGDDSPSTPSLEENPEAPRLSESKFGEIAYHSIRRFVVVKARKGHCLCLPIFTYGGKGTRKPGIKPNDHAIIYTGRVPPGLLPNEKRLRKRAIRVVGLTERDKLDAASRLNYNKVYTVEHNIKVYFIGKIHKDSEAAFFDDFKNAFDEDDELRTMEGALRDPK